MAANKCNPLIYIPLSSNGRTADSDSAYIGSNPVGGSVSWKENYAIAGDGSVVSKRRGKNPKKRHRVLMGMFGNHQPTRRRVSSGSIPAMSTSFRICYEG